MNKQEFMDRLKTGLKGLPWPEVKKQLDYYEEILSDMLEDGMTQEEATEKLGAPEKIVAQIRREVDPVVLPPKQETPVKPKQRSMPIWGVVLLIVGAPVWVPLALAVILAAASIYLSLWSMVVSIYAATLGIGIGGVGLLVLGAAQFGVSLGGALALLGSGLLLLALTCLMVLVSYYATMGMVWLTRWTVRGIRHLTGKKEEA